MEHLTNGLPEQAPAPLQCSLAVHSLSSSPGVPGAQNSQYQAGWSTGSQVAYKHGPQLGRVPLHTAQAGLGQVRRTVSAATRTAAGTPIVLREARICTYHPKGFALQRVPARWPMTGVQQDVRRTTLCGGTPERTEESADPGPGSAARASHVVSAPSHPCEACRGNAKAWPARYRGLFDGYEALNRSPFRATRAHDPYRFRGSQQAIE